jgi:hypothetical protein
LPDSQKGPWHKKLKKPDLGNVTQKVDKYEMNIKSITKRGMDSRDSGEGTVVAVVNTAVRRWLL